MTAQPWSEEAPADGRGQEDRGPDPQVDDEGGPVDGEGGPVDDPRDVPVEVPPPPPATRDPFSARDAAPIHPLALDYPVDALLHQRGAPPAGGWRRALHRASGGRVDPGDSRAVEEMRALLELARRPLHGARTIAVVSTKGGVGKTSTTVNLGHTFATHRGDRVVALDANPDAGSLAYRVERQTTATALDLLERCDSIERYVEMRTYTSQAPSRLEIVASPDDPRLSRALGREDYQRLLALLARHYLLILADCGTGILDSATRGVVQSADQLVVVTGPSVDAGRAVTFLLSWLAEHGMARQVAEAVVVINAVRPRRTAVDVDALERHFARMVRATVQIPWDPELATGAITQLDMLQPITRDAYVRLAAAVAGGFNGGPTA